MCTGFTPHVCKRSCESTATKYDDLDEVCQPFVTVQQEQQQLAPPLNGFKLDTCDAFLAKSGSSSYSSAAPSVSTPIKAAAAPAAAASPASACVDAPRRWHDQDAGHAGSSWESASSGLSSTISLDSSRAAKPHGRRVRFSDCGADACAQSSVSLPTTPSAPAAHDQQARAVDFIALLNSGSIAELPRSVTRCYQRGRFMVEEGVLSPCLSGSNVLAAAAAPPPVSVLHRSSSMPNTGAASHAQHWRTLSTVMDMDESPSSSESGCDVVPMDTAAFAAAAPVMAAAASGMAAAAAAAPMAVDCADDSFSGLLGGQKAQASPRSPAVSFVRRGRFLVQTYL